MGISSHVVFFSSFFLSSFFLCQIIEPLVSKQWFVSMEPLAEKALHAVEKGEITIIPERFEKVCDNTYLCGGLLSSYSLISVVLRRFCLFCFIFGSFLPVYCCNAFALVSNASVEYGFS